jgi:hypothetical protein
VRDKKVMFFRNVFDSLLFQSSILNLQFAIKKRFTQHARRSLSSCPSVLSPQPALVATAYGVSQQWAPSLRRVRRIENESLLTAIRGDFVHSGWSR